TWTIDPTAPDITILRHPNPASTSNSATFNVASTDATASFLCQLDAQPRQTCTAWPKYAGVPDGTHTFTAWARDPAGNVSTTPASFRWLQDTLAPTISVTGPTSITYGTSPSWTETASEPVTFYCSKDGGTYKLCPSPTTMNKPS